MKQHKLISFFLVITFLLVGLSSWTFYKRKSWKREYYTSSIGVAENHPVDLYAKLITQNGEKDSPSSLYDEDYFGDWGWSYASSYDIEHMPLPDSLHVHWVSLRERKFYKGIFKLPQKIIDSIFRNNEINKLEDIYYYGKHKKYFNFSIGIAPKGKVTVWIQGKNNYQKVIAHFQALESDGYSGNLTAQEAIDISLNDFYTSNKKIDSIIKNNIPPEIHKWEKLGKKFTYYIISKNLPKGVTSLEIDYFNQDSDEYNVSSENKFLIQSGAPKWIRSNEFDGEKQIYFKFNDSIILTFEEKRKYLSPKDTLVFLLQTHQNKKSTNAFVTTINEIDSLSINK